MTAMISDIARVAPVSRRTLRLIVREVSSLPRRFISFIDFVSPFLIIACHHHYLLPSQIPCDDPVRLIHHKQRLAREH